MSAGLDVEEFAELLDVDKVSIDAHAEAEWRVHLERSAKPANEHVESIVGSLGDEVP